MIKLYGRKSQMVSYSIIGGYELWRHRGNMVVWYKMDMELHYAPLKSFILWLLWHQRLKTKSYLGRWGMTITVMCEFCNDAEETCAHLFFQCRFTKELWRRIVAGASCSILSSKLVSNM
ncbi:hypothetical protein SLE2022_382020 [Rubroshorea leprosula]